MTLFFLVLYLVILVIRPSDWVEPVVGWPFEATILVALLLGVLVRVARLQNEERIKIPQLRLMLGWFLAVLLSNLKQGDFVTVWFDLRSLGMKVVVFLAFLYLVNSINRLKWVLLTIVLLAATMGLQGIYQVDNGGWGWANQPPFWKQRIYWVGIWDGPNVLAFLLAFSFPFILEFAFGSWSIFTRMVAVGSGVLVSFGLMYAQSRGALLAVFIVFMVYFFRRMGTRGLLVGGLFVVVLLVAISSRLLKPDEADDQSSKGRIDMWAEALEMVRFNPLLGVGKHHFADYTHNLIAHNTFLQVIGEVGLIGAFFWISLLYFTFKCLNSVLRTEGLPEHLISLSRAVWIAMVCYLIVAFFLTIDFELFYISVGLAGAVWVMAQRHLGKSAVLDLTWKDLRNISSIEAAGIVVMSLVTRVATYAV